MATSYKVINHDQFSGDRGVTVETDGEDTHYYLPGKITLLSNNQAGVLISDDISSGYLVPDNNKSSFAATRDDDNNKLFSIADQEIKYKLLNEGLISQTEVENNSPLPDIIVKLFSGDTLITDNRFIVSRNENNISGIYVSLNPAYIEDIDGEYSLDLEVVDYQALAKEVDVEAKPPSFSFKVSTISGVSIQEEQGSQLFVGGAGLPTSIRISRLDKTVSRFYVTVMSEDSDYLTATYSGKYPQESKNVIGNISKEINQNTSFLNTVIGVMSEARVWDWSGVMYDDGVSTTPLGSGKWTIVVSTVPPTASGQTVFNYEQTSAETFLVEPSSNSDISDREDPLDYSEEQISNTTANIKIQNTGGTSSEIAVYGRYLDNGSDELGNLVSYGNYTVAHAGSAEGLDVLELSLDVNTKYFYVENISEDRIVHGSSISNRYGHAIVTNKSDTLSVFVLTPNDRAIDYRNTVIENRNRYSNINNTPGEPVSFSFSANIQVLTAGSTVNTRNINDYTTGGGA